MINFKKIPSFSRTIAYLEELQRFDARLVLHEAGREGVKRLREATPKDSGETANAWDYKIKGDKKRYKLIWTNSIAADRTPLVLMLQYGHGTRGGYFVSGRDFINPALMPVYDALLERVGQEVRS